jgi:maleylacetate reductase
MEAFQLEFLPSRVVFGAKAAASIRGEVARLGCVRPMVLASPPQEDLARSIADQLVGLDVSVFADAAMHTPITVTEDALAKVEAARSDVLVSIGGGSAIGLGKAIALRGDLPQIAVPTTYAGSEATPILGETVNGRKVTQRSPRVLPEVIIYDVALTLSLPVALSVTSGVNAIAHAAEALYARNRNPLSDALACDGIRALGRSLRRIVDDPHDGEGRSDALYGAWACGMCLGSTEMSLHHKLCHTLGGRFDLPHSELHCVLLPYSLAYNASAAPVAMMKVAEALGVEDAPTGLWEMSRSLGAPSSLQQIGMPFAAVEWAARATLESRYPNPAPLVEEDIRTLLERAFHGRAPN